MSKPLFLTKAEQGRCKKRGLKDARAAIAAVTSPEDMRNNQELLDDLMCGLRFFANAKRISFREAVSRSETHHMIETGKLSENHLSAERLESLRVSVSRLTTRRN